MVERDPDAFFEAKGFQLRCHQSDGYWWADLNAAGGAHPRYGRGGTCDEAKADAKERWLIEQEPPDG